MQLTADDSNPFERYLLSIFSAWYTGLEQKADGAVPILIAISS